LWLGVLVGKNRKQELAENCKYENKSNLKPIIDDIVQMLNYSEIEPEELKVIKEFPDDLLQKIKELKSKKQEEEKTEK